MDLQQVGDFVARLGQPQWNAILRIQTVLLSEMESFARSRGFVQLTPILLSPITDPLSHDVYPAEILYCGHSLKLTASMIFHKQLALIPEGLQRIFVVSPNIRLEKEQLKDSENHLIEFLQFDFEMKDAGVEDVMGFVEELFVHIFTQLKTQCMHELDVTGRKLPTLKVPFSRYRSEDLLRRHGRNYQHILSEQSKEPCFIVSLGREFYDREDPDCPGTYRNFDLIYPEGFGEALSGAEREWQYRNILRRMNELGMSLGGFENYLDMAKRGLLPRTAGAGIGIQRLLRFITGSPRIADVCLFDRGILSEFVF